MNNSTQSRQESLLNVGTCSFDDWNSKVDAMLYILLGLATIAGNITVFVCYCKCRLLKSITNIYILSLSASDLLVATISIPFSFGMFLCKLQLMSPIIYAVCDMIPGILSIYALVLVAFDRALAISRPFIHNKYMSNQRAVFIVLFTWVYVFTLVVFVFFITPSKFTLFIVVMSYIVPVLLMIMSYAVIAYVAKKHSKQLSLLDKTKNRLRTEKMFRISNGQNYSCENSPCIRAQPTSDSQMCFSRYSCENSPCLTPNLNTNNNNNRRSTRELHVPAVAYIDRRSQNEPETNLRRGSWLMSSVRRFSSGVKIRERSASVVNYLKLLKRELKAALTLSLLLSCFILSWTPFMALNIKHYFCPTCYISGNMIKYFKMLHYTNSALNPILYIVLNRQWRAAFLSLICKKRHKTFSVISDTHFTNTISGW